MQQDAELLNSIYQNAKMGEEALNTVITSVDSDHMKSELQSQMAGYSDLYSQAQRKMAEQRVEPRDVDRLTKASTYIGAKINTLLDHSTSHIAELLIQGSTMGVIEMTESMNKFTNASTPVKDLANKVVTFENQNIERMKTYLQ